MLLPGAGLRPSEGAALTALLLTLGLLFSAHIEVLFGGETHPFDESVYYESALALADGARLGSQVFASQPPLFFDGLMLGWKLTGGGIAAMHGLALMIALIGCALGYALVRPLAGRTGGLAAVALLGFAFSGETPVIAATVPSIVFGLAALAAGERAPSRSGWAFAAGALVTAAISVKLLALPFVGGLAALIVSRRLSRKALALMALGAAAAAAVVVAVHAHDLMTIWQQAVVWQAGRRSAFNPIKIVRTAGEDIGSTWMLPALLAITAALIALNRPTSWRRWIRDRAPVLSVLVFGLVYLSQIDLNPPHLVLLSAALAVLAASACPPGVLIPSTIVAVALAGTAVVLSTRPLLGGGAYRAMRNAAAIVRANTAPREAMVSDLPQVPLFADRRSVPQTIESSQLRLETGSLTRGAVLAASRKAGAVVIGTHYRHYIGKGTTKPIVDPLKSRFPVRRVLVYGKGKKHKYVTVLIRRRPPVSGR